MLHAQRYLAPGLFYLSFVTLLATNDGPSVLPVYGLASAGLFICAAWIAVVLLSEEDAVQRSITVVNSGSSSRVLIAGVLTALIVSLLLGLVGLTYPLLSSRQPVDPVVVVAGLEGVVISVCTGVAIGVVCSPLTIPRLGYSLLATMFWLGVVTLSPWIPLVHPALKILFTTSSANASTVALAPIICYAVTTLVICGVTTHLISTRQR
ncbi:hypothetical protein [Amycolatopsis sp. cmx-11-12]|uniref:hypothetical protein n=1 Tax=Amycolatopsis sp. cmx-11-12 TaxID=2785795 RepID=UPI003917E5B6